MHHAPCPVVREVKCTDSCISVWKLTESSHGYKWSTTLNVLSMVASDSPQNTYDVIVSVSMDESSMCVSQKVVDGKKSSASWTYKYKWMQLLRRRSLQRESSQKPENCCACRSTYSSVGRIIHITSRDSIIVLVRLVGLGRCALRWRRVCSLHLDGLRQLSRECPKNRQQSTRNMTEIKSTAS